MINRAPAAGSGPRRVRVLPVAGATAAVVLPGDNENPTHEPADLPADVDPCGAERFLRKTDIDAAALLA